jgi:hypothetical protein
MPDLTWRARIGVIFCHKTTRRANWRKTAPFCIGTGAVMGDLFYWDISRDQRMNMRAEVKSL